MADSSWRQCPLPDADKDSHLLHNRGDEVSWQQETSRKQKSVTGATRVHHLLDQPQVMVQEEVRPNPNSLGNA